MTSYRGPMAWEASFGARFSKFNADEGGNATYVLPFLLRQSWFREQSRVLSVGAGYGLLEAMLARDHKCEIGYVDPSPELYAQFLDRVKRWNISERVMESINKSCQTANIQKKYDYALAVHSWYYVGCDEESLEKIFSALNPGARFVIVISSMDCALSKVIRTISPTSENDAIHAEHLIPWIKDLGYDLEVHFEESVMDRNRYLEESGEFCEKGRNWVEYMARVPFHEIPYEKIKKAKDILDAGPITDKEAFLVVSRRIVK